jgi:hypothetical protein
MEKWEKKCFLIILFLSIDVLVLRRYIWHDAPMAALTSSSHNMTSSAKRLAEH